MSDVVKQNRLRWLGRVLQKDDGDWVKKNMSYEVEGLRGRPRPMWNQVHMRECGLKREMRISGENCM